MPMRTPKNERSGDNEATEAGGRETRQPEKKPYSTTKISSDGNEVMDCQQSIRIAERNIEGNCVLIGPILKKMFMLAGACLIRAGRITDRRKCLVPRDQRYC